MAIAHNPAQHTFNWYCNQIGATQDEIEQAAEGLQEDVRSIRLSYRSPFGTTFPYGDTNFQNAYMVAYFPYYIEPLYHALEDANLDTTLFEKGKLQASFFGGGPCPEALGLAAYLSEVAPDLQSVDISIFDRESNWQAIQQSILADMIPGYAAQNTNYTITGRKCNVTKCNAFKCSSSAHIAGSDIIVAQNFLTEVQGKCDATINTFESIVRRSKCRYLVFIENNYGETRQMLNFINHRLFDKELSVDLAEIYQYHTTPTFTLPEALVDHLFDGSNGLIERKNVKYYSMIIELKGDQ